MITEKDKQVIQDMCQYVAKTKMIPKSKFVNLYDAGLIAILNEKETSIFQREYGTGICLGKDSKIYLTEPCTGIRKCDAKMCKNGLTTIGTFHNHPSTAPLPSYTDFEQVFMDEKVKHPRIDCIGGYITPKDRKIVCLTSKREFHGLREDTPYIKHNFASVEFYNENEKDIEPYMLTEHRQEVLRNGLEVLAHDPRFDVKVFDCEKFS